ncbi:unnamed protein product [Didymodactylos carnosus]|uniref:Uncharacterized protein n=1 Tax=Didymodactylos carnosus TaxID=1234261 RepID=A0A8S2E5R7_9BILA|nr:unnamed protein product [Didymodactylos carnosus]CAF3839640.1 unnamed protein product [Didymodactylos carnosus]
MPMQLLTYGSGDSWCPFLKKWLDSPENKRYWIDFQSCIEATAHGLIKEGELIGKRSEAVWMAEQLRKIKYQPRKEIAKCCITLYTRESFLYKILNKTLRNLDYSKLNTLGLFCYLLRDYSRTCQEFVGCVYRGAQLDLKMIDMYKAGLK